MSTILPMLGAGRYLTDSCESCIVKSRRGRQAGKNDGVCLTGTVIEWLSRLGKNYFMRSKVKAGFDGDKPFIDCRKKIAKNTKTTSPDLLSSRITSIRGHCLVASRYLASEIIRKYHRQLNCSLVASIRYSLGVSYGFIWWGRIVGFVLLQGRSLSSFISHCATLG